MNTEGFNPFENDDMDNTSSNYISGGNFKQVIGECPMCKALGKKGEIYEGDRSFYCSNSRDPETRTCTFILYKNNIEKLIRREIWATEVNELCEEGYFTAECSKISDESKKYTGIFKIKPMGTYVGLSLSFPD